MRVPKKWITIGKRGFSTENINLLVNNSTAGIRINTGRSTFEWAKEIIQKLNELQYPLNQIYLDIANTKPRLCVPSSNGLELQIGDLIIISKKQNDDADAFLQNDEFFQVLSANDIVYFGDGEIECIVDKVEENTVTLQVKTQGTITNGSPIGIKGKEFFHFYISDNEVVTIKELLREFPISLILSFVETKDNISWAKEIFPNAASVVPKIETSSAVINYSDILSESSTIFIGRGDLALSLGIEKIGIIQDELIAKAQDYGCKVALGTGTLDSLKWSEIPLRAEIIDITNTCKKRVDYIALTSETGGSKEPFKAIGYLDRILSYLQTVDYSD